MVITTKNSDQLWLSTQDLHKIKSIYNPPRVAKEGNERPRP